MWPRVRERRDRSGLLRGWFSAVTLAALVFLTSQADVFAPIRHGLEDLRFDIFRRSATDSILLVQIDSPSIEKLGTWPWRRSIHAAIVDKLVALGARDIALDVDFSSPSVPSEDAKLADALARAGNGIILPAFKQAVSRTGGSTSISTSLPIPSLAAHSWIAGINVVADKDGRVRHMPVAEHIGDQDIPALSVMLAGLPSGQRDIMIDYGIDPSTIDQMSVADLLDGKIDPQRVRGRKVIVGANALELRDYVLVPVYGYISGSMFHALATETLLQHHLLKPGGQSMTAVLLALGILAGGALLSRRGWLSTLATLGAISLSAEFFGLVLYKSHDILVDTSGLQVLIAGYCIVAILQEIDFNKINLWLARAEARNLKSVLSQVVTDNFDGIVVADENGIIEASSQHAAAILCLPPDSLNPGRQIADHLPGEFSSAVANAIKLYRANSWIRQRPRELVHPMVGNTARILEYVVTPSLLKVKSDGWRRQLVNRYVACLTYRDKTEERHLEQETFRLAHFSELTNLPNRNSLQEKLSPLLPPLAASPGVALMVLDIDRLQSINTTLGHDFGDLLIQTVAARLAGLSANIDYVAHLGGDDFAVLLTGWSTRQEVAEIAELLLVAMSQPYGIDIRRVQLSFSAGVVVCGLQVSDPVGALIMADNALLIAKQAGGGICKFHEEVVAAKVAHRQSLEIDLWTALDKRQFSLHYQPQFDLGSGEIVGAEALLRWDHPVRGPIPPGEFIPLAEVTGLISPLGNWVLEKACADATTWPEPITVAVNLSARQFPRNPLAMHVKRALERTGLPASRLELEVTESVFMHDVDRARSTMQELQQMGISLSLDDFGTGYSSLSYVSTFPFNKLKIDRSFIATLNENETARGIVKTILSLAQHIKMRVIAEGIETKEQMNALRALGCREGQGYLLGEPQTTEQFANLLSSLTETSLRRLKTA